MSRADKLKKLEEMSANAPTVSKDIFTIVDIKPLVGEFQNKIDVLKDVLGTDIGVDLEPLVEELKRIDALVPVIKDLVLAIDSIEIPTLPEIPAIPSKIELGGLKDTQELIKAQNKLIGEVKIPSEVELKGLTEAVVEIKKLSDAIVGFKIEAPKIPKIPSTIELSGVKSLTNALEQFQNKTAQDQNDYRPADSESGDNTSYHGFVDSDGKWFILRQTNSGESLSRYRFTNGDKDYEDAWLTRAKLDYVIYSEL